MNKTKKTFSKSLLSQPMRKGKVYLHMQNLKATLLRSIQNWIHCTRFPQRWPRIKETEASAPGNVFACFTW